MKIALLLNTKEPIDGVYAWARTAESERLPFEGMLIFLKDCKQPVRVLRSFGVSRTNTTLLVEFVAPSSRDLLATAGFEPCTASMEGANP